MAAEERGPGDVAVPIRREGKRRLGGRPISEAVKASGDRYAVRGGGRDRERGREGETKSEKCMRASASGHGRAATRSRLTVALPAGGGGKWGNRG